MMNDKEVKEAYANWLDTQEWGFYCTLTTRHSMSVNAARRAMDRFVGQTSRHGEVKTFWVAEPFDTKYSYHIHALMSLETANGVNKEKIIRNAWQIASGGRGGKGFNHNIVTPYINGLGAHHYVTKYMLRQNAEYGYLIENYCKPEIEQWKK